MKKLIYLLEILIIFIMLNSVVQAGEKITVCGTGDSQALMRVLAADFEKSNPGTVVEIPETIGSGGGIKATAMGKCELGRVARHIKESEKKYGLKYQMFAKSPVVFTVHPTVTGIEDLSSEQVIGIYTGKYKNWNQLGGPDSKIYPISREEGDSANDIVVNKIKDFNIKQFISKIAYSEPEAVELLTTHNYTIAYIPLASIMDSTMVALSLDGVEPSAENVQNGKYTLVLDLGIVYKKEPEGLARKFLDYLYTNVAQQIILDKGSIPVNKSR